MEKTLIDWTNDFIIDGGKIDLQHKKLIDIINNLYSAFSEGKVNEIISEILDELVDYTKTHFNTEEGWFEKVNYIHKEEHRNKHSVFVNRISKFQQKFENKQITLSYEVMNFLRTWLQEHILGEDRKYISYL